MTVSDTEGERDRQTQTEALGSLTDIVKVCKISKYQINFLSVYIN